MANSTPPQGPIGEAGATARVALNALGSNPYVLGSVILNGALIGLLYWQATIAERERGHERDLLHQNRLEIAKLLARCDGDLPVPPARPVTPTPNL